MCKALSFLRKYNLHDILGIVEEMLGSLKQNLALTVERYVPPSTLASFSVELQLVLLIELGQFEMPF